MLRTWTGVQDYLRNQYSLENDQPDMISMVWAYEDGRSQKVILRKYSVDSREMLEIKSPFARIEHGSPELFLRKNSELPLAMIALSSDVYLVVYNAILENLTADDLEWALGRVAAIADSLEAELGVGDKF